MTGYAKYFLSFLLVFNTLWAAIAPTARAATNVPVVISHVIAGEAGAATSEFVGLYNNGSQDIELTGYCLKNKANVQFACVSGGPNVKVFIKAHNYLTIASSVYVANHSYQPDTSYTVTNQSSGSIVTSSDTLTLIDPNNQEVDMITWTSGLATGSGWQRNETIAGSGTLVDTGTLSDFTANAHPTIPANASYDVETIIDVCSSISGVQATIPVGMVIDQAGNCVTPPPVDTCPNIDGLQTALPDGYMTDEQGNCHADVCRNVTGLQTSVPELYDASEGNCVERDVCSNITSNQAVVPQGYKLEGRDCVLDLLPLQLTELLPNVSGNDTGSEFIEIYNPTDRTADLGLYILYVGVNNEKSYQFPTGSSIGPGEYVVFRDSQMKFTLVNTAGRVSLAGNDGAIISQSDAYANPADDESWAVVDGRWQYTNQPTPGAANSLSFDSEEDVSITQSPAPCPAGKYRHPLTGRCRNIEADVSVLAACSGDQYRNPETGRCRKIVIAGAATPCKDGQYRSEETNRCRNIATASTTLAPCKEGQERNSETNRCRNVVSTMPAAKFAVEPVAEGAKAFIGWWALGAVALFALGYGVWEWRYEIIAYIKRLSGFAKQK